MSPLRKTWLILAILGALLPMVEYARWFAGGGTLGGLFGAWLANTATRGLGLDLMIAGTTLVIWIIAETRVRGNREAWWAVVATLLFGVGAGLPLYLFLRSRPI